MTTILPSISRLALVCLIATSGNGVHATATEVYGGPGGGYFSSMCPAGQVVIGFRASAGAWVDGLSVICAVPNQAGAIAKPRALPWVGGRSGPMQEAYCARSAPVTGLLLTHTRGNGLKRQYVNSIGLACAHRSRIETCISSGEGCGALESVTKGLVVRTVKDYANDYVYCPRDEVLVGIQGRNGKFVDAIGLVCRRAATS